MAETAMHHPHSIGLALFDATLQQLQTMGWVYHRIDTLWHESTDPGDRQAMTIRHSYDHGVWRLHLESDRYWNPGAKPVRVAQIDIAANRLPTVPEIVSQLFGPGLAEARKRGGKKAKAKAST